MRMYSPLNAASFLRSKKAGDLLTSSSRNALLDLRPADDLGVARRPAERHQVVDHRIGEVALVAVLLERHLVAPLRQLLALLVHQHRHVRPHRRLVAERAPDHLLLGRVRQVLLGAHDVRDRHLEVVDDVGQQEHRRAVAAHEHEVLDRGVVELDLAAHEIARRPSCRPAPGNAAHAPRPARARDRATNRRSPSTPSALPRSAICSGVMSQ